MRIGVLHRVNSKVEPEMGVEAGVLPSACRSLRTSATHDIGDPHSVSPTSMGVMPSLLNRMVRQQPSSSSITNLGFLAGAGACGGGGGASIPLAGASPEPPGAIRPEFLFTFSPRALMTDRS
jgi:hypothetical protein